MFFYSDDSDIPIQIYQTLLEKWERIKEMYQLFGYSSIIIQFMQFKQQNLLIYQIRIDRIIYD